MKFILFILIPTIVLQVCEAQVVTTTSTIVISTRMTETSTQLVLGFCISQLDGPCRRKKQYHRPYHPSFYETIFYRDSGFLYNPSTVEKLEVTLINPGEGRFSFRNNEDSTITQSSLKEDNLFDHYNPYLYLRDGSSFEGRPLPSFFFFRPFANLWSSIVRATQTVFQTVKTTFTTTSYVQSTTSTATLFIKKCEDPVNSTILYEKFPKCPQESSTASSTTPFSSSTIPTTINPETTTTDGTSTTSQTTSTTDLTTPSSPSSSTTSSTSSTTLASTPITPETTTGSTTSTTTENVLEFKKCPRTPEKLIATDSFCNQKVDCPFATDEIGCSCRSRLESSKLCDGIYDCPDGEDEAGCGGCNETQLSCNIINPRPICIPLGQRCDGIEQCPGGMDESLCNILSPTQQPTEILVPKFSSGYVMRNIQSEWYPLCVNTSQDVMNVTELAYSICWMTVGNISIGEIKSEIQMINQSDYDGKYAVFNNASSKSFLVADRCPTAQLLTVLCPAPLCGRKALALQETVVRNRRNEIDKIVGGHAAVQGAWPWVVAVIRNGVFICGGTIVSSQWIVSAAHCFPSFQSFYFEVQLSMLSQTSLSPLEQIRAVHSIFLHPKFSMLILNDDIALLTVKEPFQLNQWAAPMCLPSPDYRPALGTNCTVIGWGSVTEDGPESDSLLEVSLPLTTCENFTSTSIDVDTLLCAGFPEGQKDSCQGDSGGPLICPDPDVSGNWIFAGIVSFGHGCARPGEPGAYTRLTHHLDWISQIMDNPDGTPPKFPKTNCPGFTCQRGLGTCLPKSNLCDNVVDCFDAEDETNCNISTTVSSVFMKMSPPMTSTELSPIIFD